MDWYIVIKTIKGRRYRYRQKTWRENGRVRTRSEYIGPAGDGATAPAKTKRRPDDLRILAAAICEEFLGPPLTGASWDHAWRRDRTGPDLVIKDERVEKVLKRLLGSTEVTEKTGGAYYSPKDDTINIPPTRCFLDTPRQSASSAFYAVTFHEVVHWTAHPGRIKRRTGTVLDQNWYAREELVAELGAILLMRHFNIEVGDMERHALYFRAWLNRTFGEKAAIAHAKRHAERAVRFILEHGIIKQ